MSIKYTPYDIIALYLKNKDDTLDKDSYGFLFRNIRKYKIENFINLFNDDELYAYGNTRGHNINDIREVFELVKRYCSKELQNKFIKYMDCVTIYNNCKSALRVGVPLDNYYSAVFGYEVTRANAQQLLNYCNLTKTPDHIFLDNCYGNGYYLTTNNSIIFQQKNTKTLTVWLLKTQS